MRASYRLGASQSGHKISLESTNQSKLLAKSQPIKARYKLRVSQTGKVEAWSHTIRTKYRLGLSQSGQYAG